MSGHDMQLPGADSYPSSIQTSVDSLVGMYGAMMGMATGMMMGYMMGSQQNSCPFCSNGYDHKHDEGRYMTIDDVDELMEKYNSVDAKMGQYEGGLFDKLMPGKKDIELSDYGSGQLDY